MRHVLSQILNQRTPLPKSRLFGHLVLDIIIFINNLIPLILTQLLLKHLILQLLPHPLQKNLL